MSSAGVPALLLPCPAPPTRCKGMRRRRLIIAFALLAVVACGEHPQTAVRGDVVSTYSRMKIVVIEDEYTNRWHLDLASDPPIVDQARDTLTFDDLQEHFTLEAWGIRVNMNTVVPQLVRVVRLPPIVLISPHDGDTVSSLPFEVRGTARVHDHVLGYRLGIKVEGYGINEFLRRGHHGHAGEDVFEKRHALVLQQGAIAVEQRGGGVHAPFRAAFGASEELLAQLPDTGEVLLEVWGRLLDEPDKTSTVATTLHMRLTRPVGLYFPNSLSAAAQADCRTTYPVKRTVVLSGGTEEVLRLLLGGPTDEERAQGFTTAIPAGAALKSLRVERGAAYVDLSMPTVGGSCAVAAIRAQIDATVRADIPSADTVITSIDGNVEEALQP